MQVVQHAWKTNWDVKTLNKYFQNMRNTFATEEQNLLSFRETIGREKEKGEEAGREVTGNVFMF